MRILVLNQDWFANEWRAAGHEVITCGKAEHLDVNLDATLIHIDRVISGLPGGFTPDRIVVHDNSSPLLYTGFDETMIPCLYYSVDTHHHSVLHQFFYEMFDGMFIAQKDYLPLFERSGQHPKWLPLWASRFVEASSEKLHGAVFVGNMNKNLNPERVAFFEALRKEVPVYCTTGEYWKIFPSAELVINQTVKLDLNFRVFEAMMCGPLLLTERTENGLSDLFQDGTHLITYTHGDVKEATDLIRSSLHDLPRTRRIAEQGREEILSHHLAEHRARVMLNEVVGLQKKQSKKKFFGAAVNFTVLGTKMIRMAPAYAGNAFLQALKSVERAITHHEVLTDSTALYSMIAGYSYDRITRGSSGRTFLFRLQEAYPDNIILQYAILRELLNEGRVGEAESVASRLSTDNPAVTFDRAEQVITMLLDEAARDVLTADL